MPGPGRLPADDHRRRERGQTLSRILRSAWCGLAHAARGAGVTADSPQAQVLLRVVFDGMR